MELAEGIMKCEKKCKYENPDFVPYYTAKESEGVCERIDCVLRDYDENDVKNCFSDQDSVECQKEKVCGGGNNQYQCTINPRLSQVIVAGKNPKDDDDCGSSVENSCKTIGYAIQGRLITSTCEDANYNSVTAVVLAGDVIETTKGNMDISGIYIKCNSKVTKSVVNLVYRLSFLVGNNSLATTVESVEINVRVVRNYTYVPVFTTVSDQSGGSLNLINVIVKYTSGKVFEFAAQNVAYVLNLEKITVVLDRVSILSTNASSFALSLSSSETFVLHDVDGNEYKEEVVIEAEESKSHSMFANSEEDSVDNFCVKKFVNPAVRLSKVTATIVGSKFAYVTSGVLLIDQGSVVSLKDSTFSENQIWDYTSEEQKVYKEFNNIRHNARVSGEGSILTFSNITQDAAGSHFFAAVDGGIVKEGENTADLFSPRFLNGEVGEYDEKSQSYTIILRGGSFFPCRPFITVFHRDESEKQLFTRENKTFSREDDDGIILSNQYEIRLLVDGNPSDTFSDFGEYFAALHFVNLTKNATVSIKNVEREKSKGSSKLKSYWWVLIIIGAIVLLLAALVIALLLYQRKKRKEYEALAKERLFVLQMRKDQAVAQDRANKKRKEEKMSVRSAAPGAKALIFANDGNSNDDSFGAWEAGADEWVVDARKCASPFGVVQCDCRRTLFALYNELSVQAQNERNPQEAFRNMLPEKLRDPVQPLLGIALLLRQLYSENGGSAIENITPHSLLVSTKGTLALVLKKDMKKNAADGAFENIRWNAPEMKLEERPTPASDTFSLALVMFQVAAPMHEIPFAELDAQSAFTHMATSYRPPTRVLTEADGSYRVHEIVNLMGRAWAQEPDERPPISEVVEVLSGLK